MKGFVVLDELPFQCEHLFTLELWWKCFCNHVSVCVWGGCVMCHWVRGWQCTILGGLVCTNACRICSVHVKFQNFTCAYNFLWNLAHFQGKFPVVHATQSAKIEPGGGEGEGGASNTNVVNMCDQRNKKKRVVFYG